LTTYETHEEPGAITETDGLVKYGNMAKQHRKIFVTGDDNDQREHQPRAARTSTCRKGAGPGEPLMDGPIDPHDIPRIRGEKELQRYLGDEIHEVYRLQGVNMKPVLD
jgi:DNA-directed RNA polymerase subunit beta'